MRLLPEDGIVDDVAIRRALEGDPVALTATERLEVVRRAVVDRDLSVSAAAAIFGVTNKQVYRWINYAGTTSAELFGQRKRAA